MNFFSENLTCEFELFISNLLDLYPSEPTIMNILNESVEQKIERVRCLNNSLNLSANFNNFCKSKIKVFSHKDNNTLKISESFFGKNFSLKKIFNNQPEEIKNKLWLNLHKLLFILLEEEFKIEPSKQLEDKITKLRENILNKNLKLDQTKKSIQQLFQTDSLNATTNNMIDDIFKSFETAMTGNNTMENILNLSSELSQKYEEKINNGEIDLNGLVDNLKNNIPEMGNIKNIIDPLLKMEGLSNNTEPVEKVIIDENFSTANIEIGKNAENETSKPIIGNMLKAVNSTGLLGMLSGEQNQSLGKLFDVVNKLNDTSIDNKEDLNNIFKNELGLDIDKINHEMATLLKDKNIIEE
jgi:hypothetical protein